MVKVFKSLWRSPWTRFGFWACVIAVMLYFALRHVNLTEVWTTLRQAHPGFIALTLVSVLLNIGAKAARWGALIGPTGQHVSYGKLLMSLVTGQAINWFLPGRVGELSRAYVIGGLGPGRTFVLGTVALEKVLDMVSYAILFLVLLATFRLPAWIHESGYTLMVLTLILAVGVILLASYPQWFAGLLYKFTKWLPASFQMRAIHWINSGLESLKIIHRRQDLIRVAFWTALIWGTAIWTNDLTARALHMPLPLKASLLVLIVLQAGISVPTIPGRIGIFQYLCILSLALFNVNEASALSFGIMLQALLLLPTVLLSIGFIWIMGGTGIKGPFSKAPGSLVDR